MEFIKEGYISEMMDILYSDYDYAKSHISDLELKAMDDEANYPLPWCYDGRHIRES